MEFPWMQIISGGSGTVTLALLVWLIVFHWPKEQAATREFNNGLLAQHQASEKEARAEFAAELRAQREHDDRKHEAIFGHMEKHSMALNELTRSIVKGDGCRHQGTP